jgi:hypothetical protein
MYIVGVDYLPSFQHIAFLDQETGECGDRRLDHSDGEAEKFYRELRREGRSVRVGLEATGYSRWFERLLVELGIEVWIGNAAEIKAKRVRKQKTRNACATKVAQAVGLPGKPGQAEGGRYKWVDNNERVLRAGAGELPRLQRSRRVVVVGSVTQRSCAGLNSAALPGLPEESTRCTVGCATCRRHPQNVP